MKKLILLVSIMMVLVLSSCELKITETATESIVKKQEALTTEIITSMPAPVVDYFQERRTISKWAERWDAPSIPCYVYLISYGQFIGYYVSDGKPAATTSYLNPEETFEHGVDVGDSWGDVLVSAPDIDGTWGANNPGIRFFTAEGTAVEWGGVGATYLYSDAPIPLNVPKLNISGR